MRGMRGDCGLLVLAVLALPGGLRAEGPADDVRPRYSRSVCETTTGADYTIDLGTDGSTKEAERRLRDGDITVAFVNANPFAYRYKVDAEVKEIGEPDLAQWFLAKIKVPEAPKPEAAAETATPEAEAKSLEASPLWAETREKCPDLTRAAKEAGDAAKATEKALAGQVEKIEAYAGQLGKARSDFELQLASARGARSCSDVEAFARSAVDVALPPADLPDAAAAAKALAAFSEAIGALAQEIRRCKDPELDFTPFLVGLRTAEAGYGEALAKAKEQVKTLGEGRAALDKAIGEVDSVLRQPSRFQWTRSYELLRPHRVSVAVFRAPLADKEFPAKAQHTLVVEAGRQRFLLAPGMLISLLDPVHFERAQGFAQNADGTFVLDAEGERVLAPVIVRKEASEERLAPVLALHTYLGGAGDRGRGWYFTLGVGENWAKEGLDAELLAGVTWELVPRQGFVTLGALRGVVEHLRPGFWEGKALPDELGESVPVRADHEWGVALSFTWRVGGSGDGK